MITFTLAFSHFLFFALSQNPAKHFSHIPLTSLFWFLVLLAVASCETSKSACPFVLPSSFPPYFLPVPPHFLPDTSHATEEPHLVVSPSAVFFAAICVFSLARMPPAAFQTPATFI